jgi:hypothetical protein
MNMKTFKTFVAEVYSRNNKSFLDYMKEKDFDLYGHTYYIERWLGFDDLTQEEVFGDDSLDLKNRSGLYDDEIADALENMSDEHKQMFTDYVVNQLGHDSPAEAPTWHHMDLNKDKLLPRTTWLVHFSNDAADIWRNGFKYGADDMERLGLTTHYSEKHRKREPGYNFAFVATSRDAVNSTRGGRSSYNRTPKYGKHCVIFQNSGVEAEHYGDEENQVVFWGEDVKPRDMALIVKDSDTGDYAVKANQNWKENKEYIFTGTFEKCVAWVIQNWSRYGRVLNGKGA